MKKINFKNIFKREVKAGDIETTMAWPTHFLRDWKIIVLIFALGMIIISIFSLQIYLSNEIAGGYLNQGTKTPATLVKVIDQKRLQADVDILKARQANFLKLKTNRPSLIDPSL